MADKGAVMSGSNSGSVRNPSPQEMGASFAGETAQSPLEILSSGFIGQKENATPEEPYSLHNTMSLSEQIYTLGLAPNEATKQFGMNTGATSVQVGRSGDIFSSREHQNARRMDTLRRQAGLPEQPSTPRPVSRTPEAPREISSTRRGAETYAEKRIKQMEETRAKLAALQDRNPVVTATAGNQLTFYQRPIIGAEQQLLRRALHSFQKALQRKETAAAELARQRRAKKAAQKGGIDGGKEHQSSDMDLLVQRVAGHELTGSMGE